MFHSDKHSAVLVMPRGALDGAGGTSLGRWLARGDAEVAAAPRCMLRRLIHSLGARDVASGAAALRFWGQTGERPSVWMAAADPVYFEPMLDHLRLHSLDRGEVAGDAAELFEGLTRSLGADGSLGFVQLDGAGYLRATTGELVTAAESASALDGEEPSRHMPSGAGAERYQRLLSEIQMALHLSPVQERREREGRRPINGLWIWGGGVAPERAPQALPQLFADDDSAHGYWRAADAGAGAWPGSLSACAETGRRFVAWPPSLGTETALAVLAEARELIDRGRLSRLVLLFPESLTVTVTRAQRFRFWRRENPRHLRARSPS